MCWPTSLILLQLVKFTSVASRRRTRKPLCRQAANYRNLWVFAYVPSTKPSTRKCGRNLRLSELSRHDHATGRAFALLQVLCNDAKLLSCAFLTDHRVTGRSLETAMVSQAARRTDINMNAVSAMIRAVSDQAVTLYQRGFTCLPIKPSLLTSSSMKTSTNGRSIPLST
jgi:hypothetical protein